jgi:hypothetical protein
MSVFDHITITIYLVVAGAAFIVALVLLVHEVL